MEKEEEEKEKEGETKVKRPYYESRWIEHESELDLMPWYMSSVKRRWLPVLGVDLEYELMIPDPLKQKIVVLGASGKVGRLVVKQLVEMPHLRGTVVAVVRNYAKARELFEDALTNRKSYKSTGPKLEVVVSNLVTPRDLPGPPVNQTELDSAATNMTLYGHRITYVSDGPDADDLALQGAIKMCTAIISCVGGVRPTNLWTDFLAIPLWRLFRRDVSGWCKDENHPYYVHYTTTKKALKYAEEEQGRRDRFLEDLDARGIYRSRDHIPQKIRFVRLSDLWLSKTPWRPVSIVTNLFQSMVFRYQDMTERLLEESDDVDTIAIRPGDLRDATRNPKKTSLQVCSRSEFEYPAEIGRGDVAELAVAATLFHAAEMTNATEVTKPADVDSFHLRLSARWAGQCETHVQGNVSDGHENAFDCVKDVLTKEQAIAREENQHEEERKGKGRGLTLSKVPSVLKRRRRVRRLRPYAAYVAVTFTLLVGLVFWRTTEFCAATLWTPHVKKTVTTFLMKYAWFSSLVARCASILEKGTPYIAIYKDKVLSWSSSLLAWFISLWGGLGGAAGCIINI